MSNFYDWRKTLSNDADVTIVIGPSGVGKTFGLRQQCIRDLLNDDSRFKKRVKLTNVKVS